MANFSFTATTTPPYASITACAAALAKIFSSYANTKTIHACDITKNGSMFIGFAVVTK